MKNIFTKQNFDRLTGNYEFVVPALLLISGLYFTLLTYYGLDFSMIPGDLGDARFNNYILEHGYKFMTGKISNYWDAPFMYPYKNVIAFSDNLLGTVPLYSIFRILHFSRETSFQLWLMVIFILNYGFCYWVLKQFSNNRILAAVGAYIYTFSIFIIPQITNVQVCPRFVVPLVFYWGWKYLTEQNRKYLLYVVLAIVYQFYCGIYLGFFLLYFLMFVCIAYLLIYRSKNLFIQFKSLRSIIEHLLIVLLGGLLLAPLLTPYLEISKLHGMREFSEVKDTIPYFSSYFFTSKSVLMWGVLSNHGINNLPMYWCHYLFAGAMPWLGILLMPIVFLTKKVSSKTKKLLSFLVLSLFLCFIFCLNFGSFTLYEVIFKIPGFSSMRSINRIINIEIILFIFIFILALNVLSRHFKSIKLFLFCSPLLVVIDNLISVDGLSRYNIETSQNEIAQMKAVISKQYNPKYKAIAYMYDNIQGKESEVHLNVMLASQDLNINCVNSYTGSHPGVYNDFFSKIDDAGLDRWLGYNQDKKSNYQLINKYGLSFENSIKVSILSNENKYFCFDKTIQDHIIANRSNSFDWETFYLINISNDKYIIRCYNNSLWELDSNNSYIFARIGQNQFSNRNVFSIEIKEDRCFIKTYNGEFLALDSNLLLGVSKESKLDRNTEFRLEYKKSN